MTQLALPFPSSLTPAILAAVPWRHRSRYAVAPAMFSLFDDFDSDEQNEQATRCDAKPGP